MRRAFLICGVLALTGCATEPGPTAPGVVTAPTSGAFAFHTAGSLVRSADGRTLVPGEPQPISADLRLPRGNGPFPPGVLAHGCNGNRNDEPAWGPVLRAAAYSTCRHDY